jgi:molybdate transport system permease protein
MTEREAPINLRQMLFASHARLARRPASRREGQRFAANHWRRSAWRTAALPLVLFFTVPIALLLVRTTPQHLVSNLASPQVIQAIQISLRTSITCLGLTLLFGTPLAYLIGRRQFPLKRLLDTFIDLPTVLPPSVAGIALLITFGRRSLIGGWLEGLGFEIAFTSWAVVLAQLFVAGPLFIRSAALGFAAIDPELEQAAQLDGASRWQVFRYVVLPLTQYALISGGMMTWARALGEFGATIIFAGNFQGRTQTMATAIYLGFEVDLNIALTLSALLLLISFSAMLAVKLIGRRQTVFD